MSLLQVYEQGGNKVNYHYNKNDHNEDHKEEHKEGQKCNQEEEQKVYSDYKREVALTIGT